MQVSTSPVSPVPTRSGSAHTVAAGENIYDIARQYQVDAYAIAVANNLQPPFELNAGQVVMIPESVPRLLGRRPRALLRKTNVLRCFGHSSLPPDVRPRCRRRTSRIRTHRLQAEDSSGPSVVVLSPPSAQKGRTIQ
ncbi:MAG: LysM peptidoglycan-binding domain-containing protein [Defluviicoccus sp.]|nr:MAG: LysM peptidoglycan-binding domain-containing protein [Defluviicoccus sp.]